MQAPEYTPHVATTLPRTSDLLHQLSLEHRQIQEFWVELQRAHRHQIGAFARTDGRLGDVSQSELGRRIIHALAEHEAAELDLLYPAAARVMNDEWAEQAKAEHADMHDQLADLDGENPEDEEVYEVFNDVMARAIAHIEEEERVVFPSMRVILSAGELVDPRPAKRRDAHTPPPEVVDLVAAEREMAGDFAANGRKDKIRRKLLRR